MQACGGEFEVVEVEEGGGGEEGKEVRAGEVEGAGFVGGGVVDGGEGGGAECGLVAPGEGCEVWESGEAGDLGEVVPVEVEGC